MNGDNRKWSGPCWTYSSPMVSCRSVNVAIPMEGQQWERIASSFHYQQSSCGSSGVKGHSSPPWPPYAFYLFSLHHPLGGTWGTEVCLAYSGQQMMARDWVQPSATTIFNFPRDLFAHLHTPGTTLLLFSKEFWLHCETYRSALWVSLHGPFWFLHLIFPLTSAEHRKPDDKTAHGQILLLFSLWRCCMLHLNSVIKTLFSSAMPCALATDSERELGTYQYFLFSSIPTSQLQLRRNSQRSTGSHMVAQGQVFRTRCRRYLQMV